MAADHEDSAQSPGLAMATASALGTGLHNGHPRKPCWVRVGGETSKHTCLAGKGRILLEWWVNDSFSVYFNALLVCVFLIFVVR